VIACRSDRLLNVVSGHPAATFRAIPMGLASAASLLRCMESGSVVSTGVVAP
jgi:hypothetical protein